MTGHDLPLPPYRQIRDFLDAATLDPLLDRMIDERSAFEPATVRASEPGAENRVDPNVRLAAVSRAIGPLKDVLESKLLAILPQLADALGASGPLPRALELELAAYGDGAHFSAHSDIPFGEQRRPLGAAEGLDRVLSAVLYFHRQPKGFEGGNLRLFRFGPLNAEDRSDPQNFIDIEPLHNSLAVFPSWVVHEVRPVSVASGRYEDGRFSLNCWYCRAI